MYVLFPAKMSEYDEKSEHSWWNLRQHIEESFGCWVKLRRGHKNSKFSRLTIKGPDSNAWEAFRWLWRTSRAALPFLDWTTTLPPVVLDVDEHEVQDFAYLN